MDWWSDDFVPQPNHSTCFANVLPPVAEQKLEDEDQSLCQVSMIFRAMAVGTAFGIVGFFATFLAAMLDIRSEGIVFYVLTPSLVLIAVGLLVMIAHLNVDKTRSTDAKAPFRSALWWRGHWRRLPTYGG